jgi:hypothetical protein
MQTKGNKSLKNISMSEVMGALVANNGGLSAVCRKLGYQGKEEIKRVSVKISHYVDGTSRPKADFIQLWKDKIGDDILALEKERNVSRGTNKPINITSVEKTHDNKGKLVPEEVYRDLVESNSEYRLVPKVIMDDYEIVPKSHVDVTNKRVQEIIDAKNDLIKELRDEIADLKASRSIPEPAK